MYDLMTVMGLGIIFVPPIIFGGCLVIECIDRRIDNRRKHFARLPRRERHALRRAGRI